MPREGMLSLVMVLHHPTKRTEVDDSDGMLAPMRRSEKRQRNEVTLPDCCSFGASTKPALTGWLLCFRVRGCRLELMNV